MRVRFLLSAIEGLPGVHTTYWTGASSTPVAADALDVSARVRAFWNSLATSLAAGLVVTTSTSVDVIDSASGTLLSTLPPGSPANVTGTGSGSLPSATMGLLKLATSVVLNGRFLKGRSFIGPLSTTVNSLGNPTPAFNTALLTAAGFYGTGATASTLQVWHRPTALLPVSGIVAPVTSFGTSTEFSVLRSRRD
jgi:hypothetical protein